MLRSFGLLSLRMKEGGMFAVFQIAVRNLTKTLLWAVVAR